jgi:hypothetical protein
VPNPNLTIRSFFIAVQGAVRLALLGVLATCTALIPSVDDRCLHVGLDRVSFDWFVATCWVYQLVTLVSTAVLFAFSSLGMMTTEHRHKYAPSPAPRPLWSSTACTSSRPAYSDEKANRNVRDFGWEIAHEAADFPRHDCGPYSHVHVRRESLGFVARSRAIFCHAVPNLSIANRNFIIGCTAGDAVDAGS